MGLDVHTDIPDLPGDAWAIRRSAELLRSTISDLERAKSAALRLDAVADGEHWQGTAFDAFRVATERKPLPAAIVHAEARMHDAATQLVWFADRFEANLQTIRWCRTRLGALPRVAGVIPDELRMEVQAILADADEARRAHRISIEAVAAAFDHFDDETTYATPPPSNLDKARNHVGEFVGGMVDATVDLAALAHEALLYANPATAPAKMRELWDHREQIVAVITFAVENPATFATEVGKAVLDVETWTEDGVARWLGRRIPDIVLGLTTFGMAPASTTVINGLRGVRGVGRVIKVADDVVDMVPAFTRVGSRLGALMPSVVMEKMLLRSTHVQQLSAAGRRATAKVMSEGASDFSPGTRVALVGLIGADRASGLTTPATAASGLAERERSCR